MRGYECVFCAFRPPFCVLYTPPPPSSLLSWVLTPPLPCMHQGAAIDFHDSGGGRTPLHWATVNGYIAIAELLLDKVCGVRGCMCVCVCSEGEGREGVVGGCVLV